MPKYLSFELANEMCSSRCVLKPVVLRHFVATEELLLPNGSVCQSGEFVVVHPSGCISVYSAINFGKMFETLPLRTYEEAIKNQEENPIEGSHLQC